MHMIKKILLGLSLMVGITAAAHASDPVDMITTPKANYGFSYGTIVVTSTDTTPAKFSGTNNVSGWQEIYLVHPSSSSIIYEMVSSGVVSTSTVVNSGFPFQANLGRYFNSNKDIYFFLGPGEAPLILRYEVIKRQ